MRGAGKDAFRLGTVPTIALDGELVRVVAFHDLLTRRPPDFLYVSRRPNRFNPAGVECVYFSSDERTALTEYLQRFASPASAGEPRTTFFARARLARIIDLTDAATLSHVGLEPGDLIRSWRLATEPVPTQRLGAAVARTRGVAGIRYRSVAARRAGLAGWNVVVFRKSLAPGDRLEIVGPEGEPLAAWP